MARTQQIVNCISTLLVGLPLAWGAGVQAEQPYQVEWITQFGTMGYDPSLSMALDGVGNTYITGWTTGNLGGIRVGAFDAFLTKFDGAGTELWSRQFGTTSDDLSLSVAVDGAGNAYISGWTWGSLVGPNAGDYDLFLMKFDPSGVELWSKQIGTTSDDKSFSVAVDGVGNAYISGYTNGSLGGPHVGGRDAFLTKFDPSGVELWSSQIGTTSDDLSLSVALDGAGNTYISGYTNGSLGGPHVGGRDAFLTKFDPSGVELWSRQFGTTGDDASYSITVDGAGNAYISGYTEGSLVGPHVGALDAFLTKFDPSGVELWSQQIGTTSDDMSFSVAVDGAGNAYISGYTRGSLGGPHVGGRDAFLTKFDPSGVELWSWQIGTISDELSYSVDLDGAGNAYISGYTGGSLGGPNLGQYDAFLVKLAFPELAGDLDGDGFVGITDLNLVLSNWNQNVASGDRLLGDPSDDGFVGIEDLNLVLGNWNLGTPPTSNVPEPATAALLLIGSAALLRRAGR